MKTCCQCKQQKPYQEYYKDKHSKDGFAYQCKACRRAYEKQYSTTDKYKQKIRKQRWKEQNIGITYEQYVEMFVQQDGACAICNTKVNQFNKGMCVDHCHITNKVRGLLCTDCNRGIGSLKDNIKLLHNAISYLEKYND